MALSEQDRSLRVRQAAKEALESLDLAKSMN